ncbi:MAG TPA: glycosyltransferase 87 family protein, partial [Thermoanaerobaculia bacterium]|nr:glycosyltransferase 87 family protein [Thermoanaerobaculia bacterium]
MKKALAVVLGIYTAAHFYFSGIRQPLANFYGDFLASFPSWRLSVLFGRLDLYKGSLAEFWAMRFGGTHPLWHYGPVEHLVTLPLFAFGNLRSAYIVWLVANYVFLIAIIVLAAKLFEHRALAVLAILNYGPLFEALTQRTIEIFELLLLFIAFASLRRERKVSSGVAIGFAAMTKFL